ncbi:SH3 domain-containing protein [Streptomyces sp. NPDC058964]|uniref:SH3 domain-containing protein n=1 Tax=Streptomyces sp. NPDC058964 TaxID=3346681 RepID=UPI0036A12E15
MIRRTVKSGLLATVAVLAFLPTAAGAAETGHAVPQPAPAASTQYTLPSLLPAPARHKPARHRVTPHKSHRGVHRAHRATHRVHRLRHLHRVSATHCAHRVARRVVPPAGYRHGIPAVGRVATHHVALNVRSGPGTGYRVVGHRHPNRLVALTCRTGGSRVYGNRTWYRLSHHRGYVSARYIRVRTAVPWC